MTRSQSVVDQLRDLILTGAIAPGEYILETQTAARLGISRTPLRPALASLAQEGLLQARGARGFRVRELSLTDVMDAFLVRANLEGLAVAILAQTGVDDAGLAAMKRILEHGDSLLRNPRQTGFEADFRSMNEEFHQIIVAGSKNTCLFEVTTKTLLMPLLSSRVVHFEDAVALARSHDDHWAIYKAIAGREVDRGRSVMMEHILRSRDFVRQYWKLSDTPIENRAEPTTPFPRKKRRHDEN
jgi:GntR family transcriptional regulator of vanillate catabolism